MIPFRRRDALRRLEAYDAYLQMLTRRLERLEELRCVLDLNCRGRVLLGRAIVSTKADIEHAPEVQR